MLVQSRGVGGEMRWRLPDWGRLRFLAKIQTAGEDGIKTSRILEAWQEREAQLFLSCRHASPGSKQRETNDSQGGSVTNFDGVA